MRPNLTLVSLVGALAVVLAAVAGCAPAPTPAPTAKEAPAAKEEPAAKPAAAPKEAPKPGGEPIKIAALTSLSGPFTPWGVKVRDGMKFAVQELNRAGGVLGRELVLLERDDKNNPDEATTALRSLVERDGAVAAGGVISSGVGLATSRVAEEMQVPLFFTMSGSHTILKSSSRYTFRSCLVAAPMNMAPLTAFIKEKGYKRIGAIIADYEWGHAIRESVEKEVKPLPGVTLQMEVAPVPESDFTTYLRRLQGLNPELLILMGHPPGNFAGAKQAIELGIGQFVVGSWSPPETWMERVGKLAVGRVIELSCADYQDQAYQALARRYYENFKNFFDHNAISGYAIVNVVADAIKKTNSVDRKMIAEAIRTGRFVQPGYAYPLSFTEWGELKEATPVLYTLQEGDPPGGVNPGAGWHPNVLFRSPRLEPYVPKG